MPWQHGGGGARIALAVCALLAACASVAGATPIGEITMFPKAGTNIAQVRAGPDGNLWFTDRAGKIGQITTSGAITLYGTESGLNAGAQPFSMAVGRDGNLWFTDGGSPAAIGVINPTTHAISEYSAGLNAGSVPPQGIAAGPDGNVWFNDRGTTSAIGMINPTTHAITEFSAGLNPGSSPGAALALGTEGNLWFVDNGATRAIGMINPTTHAITEFATGPGSGPGRIALGPDGNLWFTDKGTTPAIAFMNPTSHAITRFSTGLPVGSLPGGISTGADGNVWFTDQGTTRAMGRTGTGAPAASITAPAVSGSGGVNVAQKCGGDTWSSWAGQQPSRTAFGFDGYQWLLDGTPIAGATGTSYVPTAAQVGHQLSCKVTATYVLLPVTVSATSNAVAVKGAAEELDDLAAAVAGVGPGASLAQKVAAISRAVAAGDTADACGELGAFGHELDAQSGKKVASAQVGALREDAQNIEAALDC
jgi:streptogramin lyase